jgi:hypothetical protein
MSYSSRRQRLRVYDGDGVVLCVFSPPHRAAPLTSFSSITNVSAESGGMAHVPPLLRRIRVSHNTRELKRPATSVLTGSQRLWLHTPTMAAEARSFYRRCA